MSQKSNVDFFAIAVRHHQLGEWTEARTAYEHYLALNPDYSHALANVGSVCRQLGDLTAALSYLQRATAIAPEDPGAHYNLGNLYLARGNLSAAAESYRHSLACPASPQQQAQAAYNLGLTLVELQLPVFRPSISLSSILFTLRMARRRNLPSA